MYRKSFRLIGWSFRWFNTRQNAANETETIVSDTFFKRYDSFAIEQEFNIETKDQRNLEKKEEKTQTHEQLNLS